MTNLNSAVTQNNRI